jgi:predicted NBD/HSP70 family sugar kinase
MTGSSYYNVEKAAAWRSGGSTQAEARVYNERLILSLIRLHGELSKVELTHLTGLAPQTITSIVNAAAGNELLLRGTPRRGGLGQPSVPYALNPAGAWSLGLALGPQGGELVLVDFLGAEADRVDLALARLDPETVVQQTVKAIGQLVGRHRRIATSRIAGLGIASPFYGPDWAARLSLGPELADAWSSIDLRAEIDARFDWPVYLLSDGVVAAGAEMMFGAGLGRADFLYVHVGTSLSGGLVLDHHLYPGRNRLAGLVGGLLAALPRGGPALPLDAIATTAALQQRLGTGQDAPTLLRAATAADLEQAALAGWIDDTAAALAALARQAIGLIDLDNIIVDGDFSSVVRKAIARAMRRELSHDTSARPEPFTVLEGQFGPRAFVLGGASIPLLIRYGSDRDLLFKD